MQPILEKCLVENSINSPVSDLTPYKIKPYIIAKVSTAFLSGLICHLIFQVRLCLDPSPQKPLVYSQHAETQNSYPFYWFSLCLQIPLIPLYSWSPYCLSAPKNHLTPASQTDWCPRFPRCVFGLTLADHWDFQPWPFPEEKLTPFYTKFMHILDPQSEPEKKKIYIYIFPNIFEKKPNTLLSYKNLPWTFEHWKGVQALLEIWNDLHCIIKEF